MRVTDTLDAGAIVTGARWPDIGAAVEGLVGRLVQSGRLDAALEARAVAAVCERERLSSTAMVDIGVSIPHARVEGLDHIIAALAVSPEAIYGASVGTPISIVALLLSPPAQTGEHLNLLSAFSLLLQSARFRRRLQLAETPEAVLALIREHERW
jgi:mannitol/fructose-specific phosphotransferase system IIA component (Ntr-type)